MTHRYPQRAITTFLLAPVAMLALEATAFAQSDRSRVMAQPDAPIEILDYLSRSSTPRGGPDGILHEISYQNRSDRIVVAIRFGFLSFNAFNEFMDRRHGYTMQGIGPAGPTARPQSGTWLAHLVGDVEASFWMGVSYVDTVRFDDGTVWRADRDAIAAQVLGIAEEFDRAALDPDGR